MDEKQVGCDTGKAGHHFLQLALLAQERELVEGLYDLAVRRDLVFDEFFEGLRLVDEDKEGVVEEEVVEAGRNSFLFAEGHLLVLYLRKLVEPLVPDLLELLPGDKAVVLYTGLRVKSGGVPANAYLLVDLSHLPGESGGGEGEVVGDEGDEDVAKLLQLFLELLAVELEGVVHDVAVVQRGYNQSLLLLPPLAASPALVALNNLFSLH